MKMKMLKILALAIYFSISNVYGQVGIGTTSPLGTLDVNGALSLREGGTVTLSSAANNTNITVGSTPYSFYRIIGPTAAFNLGSIVPLSGGCDGQILVLENTTAYPFTLRHDTSGAVANQIYCPGATNLVLNGQYSTVTFIYNKSQGKWIIAGYTSTAASATTPYGNNIQTIAGTTDTSINTSTFTDMANMSITFTPVHNIVYLSFGASGTMTGTPQATYVDFRIVNGATNTAGTTSMATDYDDIAGSLKSWNAHFSMYPVTVTAGVSTTIKIQWMRDGNSPTTVTNNTSSQKDFCHRNLTIFD